MKRRPFAWCLSFLVPLVLLVAGGCGSARCSVTGRVTYDDGSPLDEGNVAGEATIDGKLVAVQGNIQKDGSFTWGSDKPGDGALPGTYRVVVLPRALGDSEMAQGMVPAVDSKFTRYETSDITFEVKSGRNELNINVTKGASKRK